MTEGLALRGANQRQNYGATDGSDDVSEIRPGCMERLYPSGFKRELKAVLKLAGPMILSQACQYMIGPIALMFCGHLGEIPLAAVALANSLINVTGLTIALGLACACDTLFAQVYGSQNRRKLGIYLQRSLLIMGLAVLPCWAIHLNADVLLQLMGQDPAVSRVTARYLLFFMPGVLFFFAFVCISKYTQCQNLVMPTLIIGCISNGVNALLHYLVVIVAGLGIEGSAICQVISYFSMMALTLIFIVVSKVYKETWEGWSWECLRNWGEFYRLGAYGLVMLCAEYWSFEIGILAAGLIGTKYLSSMSVIYQLETMAYMFPLGTGIAASIRVGQYLGAGNSDGAQTAARVAMTFICGVELISSTVFASLRFYLPQMFTNVPEVIEMVGQVLPVCAVYQLSDGLAGTGAGILRGQGRQNLGAAIVLGGYLMALTVGTPLMLYTWLRLYAFWGGLAVALTIEGILFALIVHYNNWKKQAQQALHRVKVKSESASGKCSLETDTHESTVLVDGEANVESRKGTVKYNALPPTVDSYIKDRPPGLARLVLSRLLILCVFSAVFLTGLIVRLVYGNETTPENRDVANTTLPVLVIS